MCIDTSVKGGFPVSEVSDKVVIACLERLAINRKISELDSILAISHILHGFDHVNFAWIICHA